MAPSSGGATTPAPGLAQERSGSAVLRHGREDRRPGGEVLEDLGSDDEAPAALACGDEQEQRVGVALERQRLVAREVGDQLDAVVQPQLGDDRPVTVAEVTDEAGHDVALDPGERRNGVGSRRPKIVPVCVIRSAFSSCTRGPRSRRSRRRGRSARRDHAPRAPASPRPAAGATQTTASAYRATSRATYFSRGRPAAGAGER